MMISSMVVKTLLGKAETVASMLGTIPGVSTHGVHKQTDIIVLAEAESVDELELLSRRIMDESDGVLGVFPTFVSTDHV